MSKQLEMSKDMEQLAIELYEAITEPSMIYERGILMHVRTDHDQLIMPEYLKRQYRPAIALVFQYMWSGLKLDEGGFMVTLSFNRTATGLYIPWDAIIGWQWQAPEPPKKETLASFLQGTEPIEL